MSDYVQASLPGYYSNIGWSATIYNNVAPVPSSVYNSSVYAGLLTGSTGNLTSFNVIGVISQAHTANHNASSQAPTGGDGIGFDWFERIHLGSEVINGGLIAGVQTHTLRIHSAYREDFVSLSTITNNVSSDGVTINGISPDSYSPLTTESYIVTIAAEGTSSFEDTIVFAFATSEILAVIVSGTRLILLPWVALNGASETASWLTNVLKAYGQEQRRSLREKPVRVIDLSFYVSEDDRLHIEQLLSKQTQPFCVPFWWDLRAASAITAGDTTITVDTTDSEFKDGGLVFIYESHSSFESVAIDTVGSGVLNLADSVVSSYSSPTVVPAFGGYIQSASGKRDGNEINLFETSFQLINAFGYDAPSTTQHRGIDVLTDIGLIPAELTISQSRMFRDNGIRPSKPYALEDRTRRVDTQAWVKDTNAGREALKQWIYSRKGKSVPFFYPTWQKDFVLSATINPTDTDITVKAVEIDAPFDIMIYLTDGTIFYRQVTAKAAASPQTNDILTIDSQLSQTVNIADIDRISLMRLSRQAADSVTFRYELPKLTYVDVPVTEI